MESVWPSIRTDPRPGWSLMISSSLSSVAAASGRMFHLPKSHRMSEGGQVHDDVVALHPGAEVAHRPLHGAEPTALRKPQRFRPEREGGRPAQEGHEAASEHGRGARATG